MPLVERARKYLNKGGIRSKKLKKNIVAIFIRKGIGIVVSFITVPILMNYLGVTNYGIWLTITSFINWFNFFDFGLGNGLRNKLPVAFNNNDHLSGKKYISSTFATLTIISSGLIILFILFYPYINWGELLKSSSHLSLDISHTIFIIFILFAIQFVFRLISTILTADQRPAAAGYLSTFASIIFLALMLLLSKKNQSSIVLVAWAFSISAILPYILATYYYFKSDYRPYMPSFRYIDLSYAKEIFSLGANFFIIQGCALILYSLNNFIILRMIGPDAVPTYFVTFKYFSIIIMINNMVTLPLWSAITDAHIKNDLDWIKRIMHIYKKLSIYIICCVLIMIVLSNVIYKVWIGDKLDIPILLSIMMGLNTCITVSITPYINFLNGIGKIKLQLISALISAILYVPLAVLLIKYANLGIYGIMLTTLIFNLPSFAIYYTQYNKIINFKAEGIWSR